MSTIKQYAFIFDSPYSYDTQIIIVNATDKKNAYEELLNLAKKKRGVTYKSTYATDIKLTKSIKYIFDKKVKPVVVTAPYIFSFYNG